MNKKLAGKRFPFATIAADISRKKNKRQGDNGEVLLHRQTNIITVNRSCCSTKLLKMNLISIHLSKKILKKHHQIPSDILST